MENQNTTINFIRVMSNKIVVDMLVIAYLENDNAAKHAKMIDTLKEGVAKDKAFIAKLSEIEAARPQKNEQPETVI